MKPEAREGHKRVAPVRWGILGAANIALKKVIPGMQKSALAEVVAIASREVDKARAAAKELGIPRAYGSYQELIDDPDIEAIYNPLPNHLHVPWSIRAAEAGKRPCGRASPAPGPPAPASPHRPGRSRRRWQSPRREHG